MPIAIWAGLLGGGVFTGAAACAALVLPRRRDLVAAAAAVVFVALAVVSLLAIARTTGRPDTIIVAGFIATGATLGGFALAAALVPAFTRPRPAAAKPRLADDNGRTVVVLLAEGEPEEYDPALITSAFVDLEETEVPVPPEAARMLVYLSEKSRYASVHGSPARAGARTAADALATSLSALRAGTDVRAAWLDPPQRLDDTVASAAAEGYRRVAVVPFGIADSLHLDRAKRSVDALGLAADGVRVAYAAPLWSHSGIARAVADRALAAVAAPDRGTTGVVLVGHGQPWQWDRTYPAASEQETYFAQRVRTLLAEEGFAPELVRIGWLDWQDPGISEAVRHLVAFGCRRVVVVPASMPTETLGTLIDLRGSAEEAILGTHVRLDVLPAWGDHPAVLAALQEAALSAVDEVAAD
jgi:sirohydrochlorin ferrochelatase